MANGWPRPEPRWLDDDAKDVFQPPGTQDAREVAAVDLPGDQQAADADAGANGSARDSRQDNQSGDVPDSVERGPKGSNAVQKPRTGQRFQGVPERDAKHGVQRYPRPAVGEEGAKCHAWPQSIAAEHERGERDAGWGPDGGDAVGLKGQFQTELRGAVVRAGEASDLRRVHLPVPIHGVPGAPCAWHAESPAVLLQRRRAASGYRRILAP